MKYRASTPLLEAFEELDKINEATNYEASKKFWAAAKNKQIDIVSFHAAFDDELETLGLKHLVDYEGTLRAYASYGEIKKAIEEHPDSWAVKALQKLWGLIFKDRAPYTPESKEYFNTLYASKEAKAAKAKAEQEAAKEAKFNGQQELLKTYISKADTRTIAAYERVAGVSAIDGITLVSKGEAVPKNWRDRPTTQYSLRLEGWGTSSYVINEADLLDETVMIKYIEMHLRRATQDIKANAATAEFKQIDVFASNRYVDAVLLGESGILYEVGTNGLGKLMINVSGEEPVPAYKINEPYEVIYTRTSWSDNNHSTRRDSHSAIYYSWNSKYEDKLGNKIPSTYGTSSGYIGDFDETKKVANPTSSYFSHADGIDSWAETNSVRGATD